MPYEIAFIKPLVIADPGAYFNPCCMGGDQVLDRLLPSLGPGFCDFMTGQEDWGWFAWFRDGSQRFSVDVFCDDPERGAFRVFVTSHRRRFLWVERAVDTTELSLLVGRLRAALTGWTDMEPSLQRLDSHFNPMTSG